MILSTVDCQFNPPKSTTNFTSHYVAVFCYRHCVPLDTAVTTSYTHTINLNTMIYNEDLDVIKTQLNSVFTFIQQKHLVIKRLQINGVLKCLYCYVCIVIIIIIRGVLGLKRDVYFIMSGCQFVTVIQQEIVFSQFTISNCQNIQKQRLVKCYRSLAGSSQCVIISIILNASFACSILAPAGIYRNCNTKNLPWHFTLPKLS